MRVFRDCWLLFGGVDDIGYSHSLNLGRLDINRALRAKYTKTSDIMFESIAYPSVFFMDADEREHFINTTIIAGGCNVVVASSSGLLDELAYARAFPNISFIGAAGADFYDPDTTPHNLLQYTVDWFGAAFVSGVVAASNSDTCSGFITAFEHIRSTWTHTMGFVLGYRYLKPAQPVYVVTMDSYYNPPSEVLAAQQLVEGKGCDVLARHTDPNDVDKYINSFGRDKNNQPRALSIARYVDMSTFVGDTVFTSQVWDAFDMGFPLIEDAFLGVLAQHPNASFSPELFHNATQGVLDGTGVQQMRLSPFTSAVDQSAAAATAQAAWAHLEHNNPLCDARWRRTGEPVVPSTSPTCLNYKTMQLPESYLLLPNVTYYDAFQDGGVVCGQGGQYYTYDHNLNVTCHPCPENTFRSAEERAEETCHSCPNGTVADPGSAQCTTVTTSTKTNQTVWITTVVVVVVVVAIVALVLWRRMRRRQRDNTFAPKTPHERPIAILFTDIQASTTLWANAPQEMSTAIEDHHTLLRRIIHKHRGYEVKTIGDAFMVVQEDISKAVAMALDIQRVLHHHDWGTYKLDGVYNRLADATTATSISSSPSLFHPHNNSEIWNGLRIRVGIAYGKCDGQRDPVTHGWDYYGTTVNTAARVEAAAHGGQVLMTGPAYHALRQHYPDQQQQSSRQSLFQQMSSSRKNLSLSAAQQEEPKAVGEPTLLSRNLSECGKDELGIASVTSHGQVSLRGLSERVELLEVTPRGFEARVFPPLRVEEEESGIATDRDEDDDVDPAAELARQPSDSGDHEDKLLLHGTPEERMEKLMKMGMRAAGVRRFDEKLIECSWKIFYGMQAMLSLQPAQERHRLLSNLLQQWHLPIPKTPESVGKEIGDETPLLLILSIRSATVVLAEQHSMLVFQSFGGTGPKSQEISDELARVSREFAHEEMGKNGGSDCDNVVREASSSRDRVGVIYEDVDTDNEEEVVVFEEAKNNREVANDECLSSQEVNADEDLAQNESNCDTNIQKPPSAKEPSLGNS